ncbi:hypothetical protein AGMMS50225_27800 [Betaproteobacteria bacterium]|nr:hypothetical protein AGMMS50225_27800 [Betaproteobacteria bacterium]
MLPILTDVETQWDLYLANTYQIEELRSRSFEDERLPVEWFQDWLSKAKAYQRTFRRRNGGQV